MTRVTSFVRREGARLVDDAGPVRFVLGNAYYLTEEAARRRIERVDETLRKLCDLGVTVARVWAFNDDPGKPDSAIRRAPDRLEERGLRGLDRVLARARRAGVRLILPLVNYWEAYGGVGQWCAWSGLPRPTVGDPRFFTDRGVRARFCAHVAALLDRVNPDTGIRYGDDPVVLAWELANEPRLAGGEDPAREGEGADPLAGWIREVGGVVRAHARQLISLGDEGHDRSFDGYDEAFWRRAGGAHLFAPGSGGAFAPHLALDELDLASAHFYPEKWGLRPGAEREAGEAWIEEHARIAARAGKPFYVGELGLGNEGAPFARLPLAERRAAYRAWLEAARRSGAAGIGPWLFAYDARPDRWDWFTWYCRDGLPLDAPENRYADLVKEAAARLNEDADPR